MDRNIKGVPIHAVPSSLMMAGSRVLSRSEAADAAAAAAVAAAARAEAQAAAAASAAAQQVAEDHPAGPVVAADATSAQAAAERAAAAAARAAAAAAEGSLASAHRFAKRAERAADLAEDAVSAAAIGVPFEEIFAVSSGVSPDDTAVDADTTPGSTGVEELSYKPGKTRKPKRRQLKPRPAPGINAAAGSDLQEKADSQGESDSE